MQLRLNSSELRAPAQHRHNSKTRRGDRLHAMQLGTYRHSDWHIVSVTLGSGKSLLISAVLVCYNALKF